MKESSLKKFLGGTFLDQLLAVCLWLVLQIGLEERVRDYAGNSLAGRETN